LNGKQPFALKQQLWSVKKSDRGRLFYHTGDEKQVVGIMEIASDPYPDPKEGRSLSSMSGPPTGLPGL
jgi:predicted RNA-binding protein with PUA-like domain